MMGIRGVIWYAQPRKEDARAELRRITADYINQKIMPVYHREGLNHYCVGFENGDYWQIRHASESSRACYSNISYIDHTIDEELVNIVIKPATHLLPYNAYLYY